MYNLFLDDERVPFSTDKDIKNAFAVTHDTVYYEKEWVIVRNYYQFIDIIEKEGMPLLISFDHDLGKRYEEKDIPNHFLKNNSNNDHILNEEKTGYDALKWLCNYCLDHDTDLPEIRLHTANDVGFVNMRDYIKSFQKIRTM